MTKVPVDPQTLIRARELAGYPDTESVYPNCKTSRNLENLNAFEAGKKLPTVKQLRGLAKKYVISEGALYQPHNRIDGRLPNIDEIKDFRMENGGVKTPELIRFMRDVVLRQDYLNDVIEDEDIPDLGWIGSGKTLSEEQAGAKLRAMIWQDEAVEKDLMGWVVKVEERLGVAVMQPRPHHAHSICHQISGIAINHDRIPVVVLNTKDKPERRLFTLMHELAHLLIEEPGMSNIQNHQEKYIPVNHEIENRCDRISENALMPVEIVQQIWNDSDSLQDNLKKLVNKTGASFSACAVRARHLNLIDSKELSHQLTIFSKAYAAKLEKQKTEGTVGGVIRQDIKARDGVGPRMTFRSLLAFDEGRISARDLYYIFGVKLNHLNSIADRVGYRLASWHPSTQCQNMKGIPIHDAYQPNSEQLRYVIDIK